MEEQNLNQEKLVYDQLAAASASSINQQTHFVFIVSVVFIILVAIGLLAVLIYGVYATFSERKVHDCHVQDLYGRNVHCTSNFLASNDATVGGELNAAHLKTFQFITTPLVLNDPEVSLDGSRSFVIVEHDRQEPAQITLPPAVVEAGLWIVVSNQQTQNIPLHVKPPSSDLINNQPTLFAIAPHQTATFVASGPLVSGKGNWIRLLP
jgi:hypothetical protein